MGETWSQPFVDERLFHSPVSISWKYHPQNGCCLFEVMFHINILH